MCIGLEEAHLVKCGIYGLCLIREKKVWRSDFQSLYAHVMCAGALSRSKTGLHDLQDAQDCVGVCAEHDTSACAMCQI